MPCCDFAVVHDGEGKSYDLAPGHLILNERVEIVGWTHAGSNNREHGEREHLSESRGEQKKLSVGRVVIL